MGIEGTPAKIRLEIKIELNITVVLREPVANKSKYLSNKSNDQNDHSKGK
jgi:hypothetical protein